MFAHKYLSAEVTDLLFKYAAHHRLTENHPFFFRLTRLIKERSFHADSWVECLDELAQYTDNPAIGLDIGQLAEPKHAGVVGYLINSSENLAMAARQFARYQTLLYGSQAEVNEEGSLFKMSWPLAGAEFWRSDECLLSAFVKILTQLTGKNIMPTEVGFRHDKPHHAHRYREIFGDNVQFSTTQLYVKYPIEYLALDIVTNDHVIIKILEKQAESLLSAFVLKDDFEAKLYQAVLESLKVGEATITHTAQRLSMSSRSLQRALQARQTNYRDILQICRKELVHNYLKDQSLSLTDISFFIGYSEQSVFTRAFKLWFGISPNKYRRQAH
jgi:AraC-like DNA-binding protein